MNKNIFISFIFLLLLSSFTFADQYQSNTTITFYSVAQNDTLFYPLITPTANTTISNLNATVINSGAMTLTTINGVQRWTYNATIIPVGDYYRSTNIYSNGTLVAQSSETFRIVTNINTIAQDTSDVVQTIFQTFIIFLVGFLIAVLAKWLREPVFYLFSGVYFMGSSAVLFFNGQSWYSPVFFLLFGFVVIYRGISEWIMEADLKEKKSRENPFDEIY